MKRKLLILDVALIVAAIYAGVRVRDRWRAVKQRENAVLTRRAAAPVPPELAPLPALPAVLPADYADIAQQLLLDKSRNSTVVIEAPPAPAAPPAPMPPLPFYHGQMRLPGEATIVILSLKAGGANQAVHPGETIGPFKLMEANSRELAFEWEDKVVRKSLDDLLDRSGPSAQPARSQAAAAAPAAAAKAQAGPGAELAPGVKVCAANDGYADGAVVDGYRKTVTRTPFAVQCSWTQVK